MDISPSTQVEEADVLASSSAGPAAVRGGALRVTGYVGGALLSAGSAALLFRYLGVAETGQYGLVLSILAIAAGLTDLGMTAIGVRELSVLKGEDRSTFISSLLGMRIVLSVAGGLGAALFAVVAQYEPVVVGGVLIGTVALVLQAVQSTYSISLQSRLRLGWVTLADFIRQVIGVVLIILLIAFSAGLLSFFAVPIVGGIVVLVLTVILVRDDIALGATFHRGHWGGMLREILPFSVATAAATLYFRVSVVLVSLLASAEQLGYFTASFRVIEALSGVPALLVGASFPILSRAAHNDQERLRYAVARVFDVTVILGVLTVVEIAVGAPFAIRVIGGPDFEPAADVLAVQGVGLGAAFVGGIWSYTLLSLGRHTDILRIYVVGLSTGTLLVAGLTVANGALGAAIGTATVEVLLTLLGAFYLRRARPDLFPHLGIVWRAALAGAVAAVPAVLLGLPSWALILVAAPIYLGVLAVMGAVPDEIAHALRSKRSSNVE